MLNTQEIRRQLERHQEALTMIEVEKRALSTMGRNDLAERLEAGHAAYLRKRIADYQMLLGKRSEDSPKRV